MPALFCSIQTKHGSEVLCAEDTPFPGSLGARAEFWSMMQAPGSPLVRLRCLLEMIMAKQIHILPILCVMVDHSTVRSRSPGLRASHRRERGASFQSTRLHRLLFAMSEVYSG